MTKKKRKYDDYGDESLEIALALSTSLQDDDATKRNKRKAAGHINFEKSVPGAALLRSVGDATDYIFGASDDQALASKRVANIPCVVNHLKKKNRVRSSRVSLWSLSHLPPSNLPAGSFWNGILLDPLQDKAIEPVDEKAYRSLYQGLVDSFRAKNDQEASRFDREKEAHFLRVFSFLLCTSVLFLIL